MNKGNICLKEDGVNGPYKATHLWNDVIRAFRDQLPCGRHRRIMKTFENCFSGAGAIEWLLNYLKTNRNFKTDMSREKAVSLVNKLYKAGIFAEVKVSKSMQHKPEVQENRLYRFLPVSPSKSKTVRLPLAPRNDVCVNQSHNDKSLVKIKDVKAKQIKPDLKSKENTQKSCKRDSVEVRASPEDRKVKNYPPCYLITKILTPKEISQTWERVFIQRLKKALGVSHHGDIVNKKDVDGNIIMHNCVYINKNGTVTNIAAEDQFPHWVWSAMKCLARWPEPQEVGLPSYPGFEKDVFVVVKDYFLGLEQPLVPFSLYDAIINVFVFAGNHSSQDDRERQSVVDSLWTSASLENVIMNLAKKYNLLDCVDEPYDHEMPDGSQVHWSTDQEVSHRLDSKESLYNSSFSRINEMDREHLEKPGVCKRKVLSSLPPTGKNLSACDIKSRSKCFRMPDRKFGSMPDLKVSKYETAFGPDNRTVTRVYYQNGVCTDYKHCYEEERETPSYAPVETHFDISSERVRGSSETINFERVKSMEDVNPCVTWTDNYRSGRRPISFGRSKSFAGAEFLDGRASRAQSQTSLTNSRDDLQTKSYHENTLSNYTFQQNFLLKMTSSYQDLHKSRENLHTSVPHHENMHTSVPHHENLHTSLSLRSMQCGQWANLRRLPSKFPEPKPMQSQTLPRNHGSPRNTRQQTVSLITFNDVHNRDQRSVHSSTDCRTREISPVDVKSSPFIEYYSPLDTAGYGPGYRPVLDASKGKRNVSSGDLTTSCHAPSRSRIRASPVNPVRPWQITSTPLSPSCQRRDFAVGSRQSALSLSDVTPLYGSHSQNYGTQDYDYVAYPQTRLSEDRAKLYLQLITLLIPPASRRKLHMLFKMMTKMTANPNLCLDPTQSTRSLVLGTFYSAIVRRQDGEDSDEVLILQLVSFMLDFYDDIFTPPEDLKKQVNHQLKQMQRPQISYSPRPCSAMHFCQQSSVKEYEQKKKIISQNALEELLENIIKDPKMEAKEKRHRLKQFQKTYPDIYYLRFPNPESEARVIPPKPKMKDALISKSLSRLKGLRL